MQTSGRGRSHSCLTQSNRYAARPLGVSMKAGGCYPSIELTAVLLASGTHRVQLGAVDSSVAEEAGSILEGAQG